MVRMSTQHTKVVCAAPHHPFLEGTASGRRMREEKRQGIFLRPRLESMFVLLVGVGDSGSALMDVDFIAAVSASE